MKGLIVLLIFAVALLVVLILSPAAQARDPDVVYHDHFGERPTIGGSELEFADYWVMGGMVLIVAAVIALPRIFDGKDREWPVYKFRLRLLPDVNKTGDLFTRFPTRRLCGSY